MQRRVERERDTGRPVLDLKRAVISKHSIAVREGWEEKAVSFWVCDGDVWGSDDLRRTQDCIP